MTVECQTPPMTLRKPTMEDGARIWDLVRASHPLELNSSYAYVMFCHHFADTCVVAEYEGRVVGFVMAYHPPGSPGAVFVWQVAVHQDMRGMGLGVSMLSEMVDRDAGLKVRFVKATVSPSNKASQALFEAFARRRNAQCEVASFFPSQVFGEDGHEKEVLFVIKLSSSDTAVPHPKSKETICRPFNGSSQK